LLPVSERHWVLIPKGGWPRDKSPGGNIRLNGHEGNNVQPNSMDRNWLVTLPSGPSIGGEIQPAAVSGALSRVLRKRISGLFLAALSGCQT
jgi:hypothetical protein